MGAIIIDLPSRVLMIDLGRVPSVYVRPDRADHLSSVWDRLEPQTRAGLIQRGYTSKSFARFLRAAYVAGREADKAAGYTFGPRKARKLIERELKRG
jgi:hypothetical protein